LGLIDLFTPRLCVESVLDLRLPRLRELGLDALLLDVDCTLKRYGFRPLEADVAAWLARLRDAGLRLCLLSNGRGRRIGALAEQLGLPFVAQALKPMPWGCFRALRKLDVPAGRAAMVGDQIFADILAGNLAGLMTILVRPMHPEEEPWFTQFKRPLETPILRRCHFEPRLPPEEVGER